ncbi:hypothetical protein [Candidatus Albibeggiatoa sp. nov. NOAA]|uniref:hypothetical protein n=1 Tax=Candidatus Albibeggiatoa sp. nov. NOAA TaxID=3162724 RepID=UPI0033001941|nr:hypothetical protein [Thiotrichaceae bacterium]
MSEQFRDMAEMSQAVGKISRDYRIAMTEFNDAAKRREQFSMRVEQRTNYWLRLSMGGLFLLVLLLITIVYAMMLYTQSMSAQMQVLNQQFSTATEKLAALQHTPIQVSHTYPKSFLSQAPIEFPDISPALKSIEAELYHLNGNMAKVGKELKLIAGKSKDKAARNTMARTETRYIYPYAFPHRY